MTRDEKMLKLAKMMTDVVFHSTGLQKMDKKSWEYVGINSGLKFAEYKYDRQTADDVLDVCLSFGKRRKPLTFAQLKEKNPQWDEARLEKALDAASVSSFLEYHYENNDGKNPNHEKRWMLDIFVPGSAELMMINPEHGDMFPETADFFERMAYEPLAGFTQMVPPGGAGIGMHVIPVEKAIPAENQSLDIEHISYWLKKYEGQIGVSVCSCRKQQRIRNEGSGDIEADWCIGVGDFADYCRETGHGRDLTYDEAMERYGNMLPTKEQFEELKTKCQWTWTGSECRVTGPNGSFIVLPAEGYSKGSWNAEIPEVVSNKDNEKEFIYSYAKIGSISKIKGNLSNPKTDDIVQSYALYGAIAILLMLVVKRTINKYSRKKRKIQF